MPGSEVKGHASILCAWCRDPFEHEDPPPIEVGVRRGYPMYYVHEECIRAYLRALQGVES